jgi:hypothetical protein
MVPEAPSWSFQGGKEGKNGVDEKSGEFHQKCSEKAEHDTKVGEFHQNGLNFQRSRGGKDSEKVEIEWSFTSLIVGPSGRSPAAAEGRNSFSVNFQER